MLRRERLHRALRAYRHEDRGLDHPVPSPQTPAAGGRNCVGLEQLKVFGHWKPTLPRAGPVRQSHPVATIDSLAFASRMRSMNVELPDAPSAAAGLTPDEARLRVAFSLYREGRLSTPQCAELAGLSRHAFLDELARHRIEVPYDLADLETDAATLKALERP